jgi:predicted AAA+ superfamily ATPase
MIRRIAEYPFREMLAGKKVCLVLGARQVGKTTLVKHVLGAKKTAFFNFDIEFDKQRFLAASSLPPVEAMASFGNPDVIVLDEAQRLPETARIVKGWYDYDLPVKILLLGSSSLDLLSQSAEALTGRNRKLYLPPLLFKEVVSAQEWCRAGYTENTFLEHFAMQTQTLLLSAMVFGSYPEVVTEVDKKTILDGLCADYLWKDVLQAGLVKTPDLIKKLLLLLAHQAGSEVSVNELATQLQMANATVERYLELLEQTFVIFRLPSFSTNPRKEIAKSRKIYFWDTGIRNALLRAYSTHEMRSDIGSLWESWCIAEVAKANMLAGHPLELFFWRTRAQSEVDLVVKDGDQLRAFEIKWGKKPKPSRAFYSAYGIKSEPLTPDNPFMANSIVDAQIEHKLKSIPE